MKLKKPALKVRSVGKVKRVVRVLPSTKVSGNTDDISSALKMRDASNALPDDPFTSFYSGTAASLSILEPDHDLHGMAHVITISNILRQCVEAMTVNTTAYGYALEYIGPEGEEESKESQAEKKRAKRLLRYPSPGETLRQILEKFVWDRESLGFRAIEVVRNDDNEIINFNHIPAITIRKTQQERDLVEYEEEITDEDTGEQETVTVSRRFRRYVQCVGMDMVYFKEFGDPRNISSKTGEEILDEELLEREEELATEIIFDEFYTPGSTYGLPRWFGVLPAVLGSRESELVNLDFFRENAIPAMAVLVSGGALTAESFDNISQYITGMKGREAMQRVMVLEASADETGSTEHSAPAPKIDMKPMISERQQDGLFREYDNHNITKVRSSFRLPPILVGKAEDYTRASALASIKTTEGQVFSPERGTIEDIFNHKIFRNLDIRNWKFKLLGPPTTDAEELSSIISALGSQGALTPNVVIKLANSILNVHIEPVLEDWGDYPFEIISSMIDSGKTIIGLDEFIKEVQEKAPAAVEPPTDEATKKRRTSSARRVPLKIHRKIANIRKTKREKAA